MKHTHIVPPYATIRIFSLTQVPNVNGAREPKVADEDARFENNEKELSKLKDGFFEWVTKLGDTPSEALDKLLKDENKSSITASAYENVIRHAKHLNSTCPQKDPEHLLFHRYNVACVGILFGVYLKVKLDE